jgi:hypothetical protein
MAQPARSPWVGRRPRDPARTAGLRDPPGTDALRSRSLAAVAWSLQTWVERAASTGWDAWAIELTFCSVGRTASPRRVLDFAPRGGRLQAVLLVAVIVALALLTLAVSRGSASASYEPRAISQPPRPADDPASSGRAA